MMNIKGIDISNHQPNINLSEVKDAGVEVVYIKSTEGHTYKDPYMMQHYNNAKANGLKVGFYHFMHPYNNGKVEAEFMWSVIKDLHMDCRIALDIEVTDNVSNMVLNTAISDFIARMTELAGHTPVIYSYHSFVNEHITAGAGKVGLWIAEYGVKEPRAVTGWSNFMGWQYTDAGDFTGSTDLDVFTADVYIPAKHNIADDVAVGDAVIIRNSAETYATGETIPAWAKNVKYTVMQVGAGKVLLKELMSWVLIKDVAVVSISVGDKVKVNADAVNYATGQSIPAWVKADTYTVMQVAGNKVLLKEIESWMYKTDIHLV